MIGKGAADENFPVASFFLPAEARPHIITFYEFARTADDISDAPGLDTPEKVEVLSLMIEQLKSGDREPCKQLYLLSLSLHKTGITEQHAHDLLKAFIQDSAKSTTVDLADLMGYCALSAAPVGRYLIDLMDGIEGDDYAPSDALCAALQILNHIQDVKADYLNLSRIYLPGDWMKELGVRAEDLGRDSSTPELRQLLDRLLDHVDALLVQAKPLPGLLHSRQLAREAAGVRAIAKGLANKLRRHDPLAGQVKLSKFYASVLFLWGALTA